jgi:hypothetical protein
MRRAVAPFVVCLATSVLATGLAQETGAWTIESEFDLFSYLGLGSIWVTAYQHPDDLPTSDAVLVVGCDDQAPHGFEVSAWVAATPFPLAASATGDVSMLVRFDQGAITAQTWFLTGEIGVQEAVAYFEHNDALFAGLATAANLALRVQADAAAGVPERTFQYDVRGFSAALGQLRCGTAPDAPPSGGGAAAIGSWTPTEEGDGIVSASADGAVGLYCVADGNGLEIDVGPYGLVEGDVYDATFRSGNVDFLTTPMTVGPFGAPQVPDDATEERLIRFLRGVVDVTVRLVPRRSGLPVLSFTTDTTGFNDAFAALGCR